MSFKKQKFYLLPAPQIGLSIRLVQMELHEKNINAIKFDNISFEDVLRKGLKVMDTTAFTLSQETKLPIIVFDMNKEGNLLGPGAHDLENRSMRERQ